MIGTKMGDRQRVGVYLTREQVAKLERLRGLVPVSAYFGHLLDEAYERQNEEQEERLHDKY